MLTVATLRLLAKCGHATLLFCQGEGGRKEHCTRDLDLVSFRSIRTKWASVTGMDISPMGFRWVNIMGGPPFQKSKTRAGRDMSPKRSMRGTRGARSVAYINLDPSRGVSAQGCLYP
jgi:hypothetical protein